MSKIVGFGLGAVAVVVALVIGAQLFGSPSNVGSGGEPTPSVEPSAEPSSEREPSGSAGEARELPQNPTAEVPPGTYRALGDRMEFTVPENTDGTKWYGAGDAQGWQIRRATDPCDGCEGGHVQVALLPDSVDDAISEWTALQNSSLSEPQPVELGGASGVEFRGSVPAGAGIIHGGYDPHGNVHVYVLDVANETVVAVVSEFDESEPFLEDGQKIVETFRFNP